MAPKFSPMNTTRVPRQFRPNPYFIAFLLVLVSLVVYLKNFRVYSTIDILDTEPNQLLPISLLGDGDFYFDEFISPTGQLPMGTQRLGTHVVSSYPIVPGLLNLPVYAIARAGGINLYDNRLLLSLLTAASATALSVGLMYLVLVEVCRRWPTALLCTLIYAFGTGVWSTASQGLWQHGPSLLFINAGLWLLLKDRPATLMWSGMFLGLAIFNRPPNVFIAVPLATYVFTQRRAIFLRFAALGAIPLLLMGWYSAAVLGSIFALGQTQDASLFSGNPCVGLPGLLISPNRGLFVFTPVFVFSAAYLLFALFSGTAAPLYRYMAIPPIALVLLYSFWYSWWGGWSFGYRLLLETVPLLIVFLALCYEAVIAQHWYWQILFWPSVLFSIYTHYLGAYYYPCGFNVLPVDIRIQPGRLWDWHDGELARCTRSMVDHLLAAP